MLGGFLKRLLQTLRAATSSVMREISTASMRSPRSAGGWRSPETQYRTVRSLVHRPAQLALPARPEEGLADIAQIVNGHWFGTFYARTVDEHRQGHGEVGPNHPGEEGEPGLDTGEPVS